MKNPSGFELEECTQSAVHATRVTKPWGEEIRLCEPTMPYSAKLLLVRAGHRLSLQIHTEKVETLTLVRGRATLLLEDTDGQDLVFDMKHETGYTIQAGKRHRLSAVTDIMVFEAASPEIGTTRRLEDDYARGDELLTRFGHT